MGGTGEREDGEEWEDERGERPTPILLFSLSSILLSSILLSSILPFLPRIDFRNFVL